MPAKKQLFVLLRWLVDETVTPAPITWVHKDDKVVLGEVSRFKWGSRTYYDAEVLRISGSKPELTKLSKQLEYFEISKEEVLERSLKEQDSSSYENTAIAMKESDEVEVHSTTPDTTPDATPAKKPKYEQPRKPSVKKNAVKKQNALAKAKAAQDRAKEIFASSHQDELQRQLKEQKEIIEKLQKQLQEQSQSSSTSKEVKWPNYVDIQDQSPKNHSKIPDSYCNSLLTPDTPDHCGHDLSPPPLPDPIKTPISGSNSYPKKLKMHSIPIQEDTANNNSHTSDFKKVKPNLIELVPGYGVSLTQRQLDEAVCASGTSPTRLIRNLVSVFFSREVLANSSCFGSRSNKGLDSDILSACFKFVQQKHVVAKSVLVDSVNDKCANCRRQRRLL